MLMMPPLLRGDVTRSTADADNAILAAGVCPKCALLMPMMRPLSPEDMKRRTVNAADRH